MLTRTLVFAGLFALAVGCDADEKPAPAPPPDPPKADTAKPTESKTTALNPDKTLSLETFPDGRKRVLIQAKVCLREGPLELLLCRERSKEHESILHAAVDARLIHTTLIAIKAKSGSPVRFDPKFTPPSGTTIKITLQYQNQKGETVTVDAKEWVRSMKTRKALDVDWVFAGSAFAQDPDDPKKPPAYLANGGNYICVSNFPDAMLDLPIDSSKENADLNFEAWTERIPEKETKVIVILEPVLDKK